MSGAVLQLVAKSNEDNYLTVNPQISFFKTVYRRYANFSTEDIPSYFTRDVSFGGEASCIVSKQGDLVSNMVLVVKLPSIACTKTLTTYDTVQWAEKIGYQLIKQVNIMINDVVIDSHYGEWLNIWSQLTGPRSINIDKLIGNVPKLIEPSNGKDSYTLYVPLQFWFCRNTGMALPIVAMQHCKIMVTFKFNDISKCAFVSPTHYIQCTNPLVSFDDREILEQNVNGTINTGIFVGYDPVTSRLLYDKVSKNLFVSGFPIVGMHSKFALTPTSNAVSRKYISPFSNALSQLTFEDIYVLVKYVFLDSDERTKFATSEIEYLVEQLYMTPNTDIVSQSQKVKLCINRSCKLLTWVVQRANFCCINEAYNYTLTPKNKYTKQQKIIDEETILFNSNYRMTMRAAEYFNYCVPYQYFTHEVEDGINVYSFAIEPDSVQPSGTFNAAQIDVTEIQLRLKVPPTEINSFVFRAYSFCYNVLRISHGLSSLLFSR